MIRIIIKNRKNGTREYYIDNGREHIQVENLVYYTVNTNNNIIVKLSYELVDSEGIRKQIKEDLINTKVNIQKITEL